MIHVTRATPTVGVAPGTTTLVLRGACERNCAPDAVFRYITPPWNGLPKNPPSKEKYYPVDPYGTDSYMRGVNGLSLSLNPFAKVESGIDTAKKWATIGVIGIGTLWFIKFLAETV